MVQEQVVERTKLILPLVHVCVCVYKRMCVCTLMHPEGGWAVGLARGGVSVGLLGVLFGSSISFLLSDFP